MIAFYLGGKMEYNSETEWEQAQLLPGTQEEYIKNMSDNQEWRDALIRLDELSKMLGETLRLTRVGWDDECVTYEDVLGPLNQIAKQIGEAIPPEIKAIK
jgi:hypothetical protein